MDPATLQAQLKQYRAVAAQNQTLATKAAARNRPRIAARHATMVKNANLKAEEVIKQLRVLGIEPEAAEGMQSTLAPGEEYQGGSAWSRGGRGGRAGRGGIRMPMLPGRVQSAPIPGGYNIPSSGIPGSNTSSTSVTIPGSGGTATAAAAQAQAMQQVAAVNARLVSKGHRFRGPDLGAASSGGLKYKDFPFPDGYTYRQWKDGSITILRSPRGGAGTVLYKDTPNPAAWSAISSAIAQVKAGRAANTIKIGGQVAVQLLAIASSVAKPRSAPKSRDLAFDTSSPGPAVVAEPFPVVPVLLGVAGLVAVLIIGKR
jgi:hypothetical protein